MFKNFCYGVVCVFVCFVILIYFWEMSFRKYWYDIKEDGNFKLGMFLLIFV